MSMTRRTAASALAALTLALSLSGAASAQTPCAAWEVDGSWTAIQGYYRVDFRLDQRGSRVHGTALNRKVSRSSNPVSFFFSTEPMQLPLTEYPVSGTVRGNTVELNTGWGGVYVGTIDATGRIDGHTYDQRNSTSSADWFSNRRMKCAAQADSPAGPPATTPPPAPKDAVAADFNADGRADILWHNAKTLEAQIWFMEDAQRIGRATVTSGGQPARIGLPFRIVASRDFNRDGKADILWHNGATGETQIWFMDGHRLADRATVVAENGAAILVGLPWRIVATSDINRDGRSDIVWHNAATGETQVWLMDRHQIKDRVTVQDEHGRPIFIGAPWRIVGSNDMDRDRSADLVWHNAATGETQIWFMNGHRIRDRATVGVGKGQPFLVGLPWRIAGTDDYNRDGNGDILWHNGATGETRIWFMRDASLWAPATVDAARDGGGVPRVGLPWRIAANLPNPR